jgi:hypothetical protein
MSKSIHGFVFISFCDFILVSAGLGVWLIWIPWVHGWMIGSLN